MFNMVRQADLAEQCLASLDRASVRDAGSEGVSWLTLRRTYSSWAHEKGVPGRVIAQLMGHAKVDTTLKVYTNPQRLKRESVVATPRRARVTVRWNTSRACLPTPAGVPA
jgi:integrase